MIKLYLLFSQFSAFYRSFIADNPFESLGNIIELSVFGIPIIVTPFILSIMVDQFIVWLSFITVGLYYSSGSFPLLGSIMFFVCYIINIKLLEFICLKNFAKWAIWTVVIIYITVNIILLRLKYETY